MRASTESRQGVLRLTRAAEREFSRGIAALTYLEVFPVEGGLGHQNVPRLCPREHGKGRDGSIAMIGRYDLRINGYRG